MKRRPPITRVEQVMETIHGQKVEDPFRWLENSKSEETKLWVEKQNEYMHSILDSLPYRQKIRARLEKFLSIDEIGAPQVYKGRYFYTKREGKQNQPVLYVREGLSTGSIGHGREKVLVDPNTLSPEGLVSLDWWYPSDDGKLLAYGLSREGSEQSTLYVMNVETGEKLKEQITRTRYSNLAWKKDNSGFYYTRYPAPGSVPEGEENYHHHLYFHSLGADPDMDSKIFGEGREMTEMYTVSLSPDNHYLLLSVFKGWDRSDVYLKDLQSTDGFLPIVVGEPALFSGQMVGDNLYLHTNYKASQYRLLKVDLKTPAIENWKELIPEEASVLEQVVIVGDRLVAKYMQNASSRLMIFSLSGEDIRDIELPTLGTVIGLNGEWDGNEVLFNFESYFIPPTVYHYDLKANQLTLYDQVKAEIDTSLYQVEQVRYESKDKTKISMFLVYKKGIKLDGNNFVYLTGYGGFNLNKTPLLQRIIFLWLEEGGIYAVPNLRGGGEYGEEWHKAGMLGNKQTVFDDFISAAEWLMDEGYTNRNKLVISGGSNGGLLMGAALTQRPDLFRVVICANPLLDMIRYHQFLIAKLWIPEYGSSEDSTQFQWLYAYSPYHRVKNKTPYPATLLLTAESDTRVDPMHAKKMTARLQAATSSDAPILLRFETKAGHGAGAPVSRLVDEYTDIWSFIFWQLGIPY